jgi:DNA-binding NarL/FixJ family response regulator
MERSKTTIVIADDHTILREGLHRLLEMEEDLKVVGHAANGVEAVEMVHLHRPSLLLLDLAMPGMNGLEVLRELAHGGRREQGETRCLLLTAKITQRQIIEAIHAGARGVVLKESAAKELLSAIRDVMAGLYWMNREPVANIATYLRTMSAEPTPINSGFGLTRREGDILVTIVDGLSNKEIAHRFSLSEDTVKHHLTSIFEKVGVSSRLELAMFAINHRIVES